MVPEENEAFRVTLSNAVNGLIVDGGAAAYIINDDGTGGVKRPRSAGAVLSSASANAAEQTVTLNFTGKLPAEAADPSAWTLAVDAAGVDVESASVQGNIVALTVAGGTLHAGDAVEVAHDGHAVGKGICNYSAEELRKVRGLKSADVRAMIPRATEEAVHRDYFVLA